MEMERGARVVARRIDLHRRDLQGRREDDLRQRGGSERSLRPLQRQSWRQHEARHRLPRGRENRRGRVEDPRSRRRDPEQATLAHGMEWQGNACGNQALYQAAPTRAKPDEVVNRRLSAPFPGDANDHLYQWEASGDYNASPGLERIQAVLRAINSADDERNPPELGRLDREIKRVKHGRVLLIAGSAQTAGHGTTARAEFWKPAL